MHGKPISAARAWNAAKPDQMRSDWPTQTRPPDADLRYGLRTLKARSRHEAQNNDHARAFLREIKSNVIGHRGVRLQSKARMKNGKDDIQARNAIEDAWSDWGPMCDVSEVNHWIDEQMRCIETVARDGEAVYRMYPGWDNDHSFSIQAIDPETLDVEYNREYNDGRRIIMGVEVDQFDRRQAYHFVPLDPLHRTYRGGGARRKQDRIRIPADQIRHLMLPEWVNQTRGVPWMSTALRRMTDLNGYDESAVVAARAGASKMGWYKRSEDSPAPFDDNGQPLYDISSQQSGGELYSQFDPGSIGELPAGVEFTGWDPSYPHSEHGSFTKAVLRGIASGLGVSYNTLANDAEGVNYNSLRNFALVDRAVYMMLQQWMIRSFHTPIFNAWLETVLYTGAIRDSRGKQLDPNRLKEFKRIEWQPRRWQWVDPLKDSKAVGIEIAQRTRSISSVIRERGEDPDEVWREIEAERARLEQMGIPPDDMLAAFNEEAPPNDG